MQEINDRLAEALERVRRHLKADEGDIEVVAIKDDVLYLKLLGSCKKCNLVDMTYLGIREIIRAYLPHIRDVVIVDDE